MNETLLREVFAQVEREANAEDCHWDQGVWGRVRPDDPSVEEVTIHYDGQALDVRVVAPNCGTAMCFAGWTAHVADPNSRLVFEEPHSNLADRVLLGDGSVRAISVFAQDALEIDDYQAAKLFDGDNDLDSIRDLLEEWGVEEV